MLSLQSNHFLKRILIYCSVIIALSVITQTICTELKTEESLNQNGDIPIFGPDEATQAPKKESADDGGQMQALSAFTAEGDGRGGISPQGRGRGGFSPRGRGRGGRRSIFDVYKCNYWNRRRCRRKLKSLDLYYCHCYEDRWGDIIRCGYRGRGGRCKTPEFN